MKTRQLTTDLQVAYQAMVDIVEDLVVNEGNNLQKALDTAEENINEAKQLSKNEIHELSRDLRDNFRLLGETLEDTNIAYKEQIKLNMSYMNDSIWDKFLNIANTSSAKLLEFTKALKEKAHTAATKVEKLTTHYEHEKWDSKHAKWLSEINSWNEEHELALVKLKEIEKKLKQQTTAFVEHAQVIQAHEQRIHEHEENMKKTEQDLSAEVSEEADEKEDALHQQERQIHAQHAELHQALKSHHIIIMAIISMLHRKTHEMD